MRNIGKKECMLPINEIMGNIKRETDYDKEGLVAMLPFLRANNDGTHRMIIPLLEKVALRDGEIMSHIIIRKILYSDVATGEVVAREEAAKFFLRNPLGDELLKPVPMLRTDIDKSLAVEYRNRQVELIEEVRRQLCENGECVQDTYMDYLKYALYLASDEFAATLLYLSRTFVTDTHMVLECRECHRKISRDIRGYREGQLVLLDCPYCQKPIRATYHKSGRCVTYNDRYMRRERSRFLEKPVEGVKCDVSKEGILDTDSAFSMCQSLQKQEETDILETGQPISRDGSDRAGHETGSMDEQCLAGSGEEGLTAAKETMSYALHDPEAVDTEKWQDVECQETKVIGLEPIKKFYKIIRSMSFLDDRVSPVPIFALFGDRGCGINTSIRYLSGYQAKEILYTDFSLIKEDCLHTFYGCIVINLQAGNKMPAWLPTALCRLKKHTTVFFVGARDSKLPEELLPHVVYRLSFKPYTIEELDRLFTSRLASYGLHVSLTKEQQMQLFKNKNALDVKRLCQQLYFRHKFSLFDGKGIEDTISEEEIAREIRGVLNRGEQRPENG